MQKEQLKQYVVENILPQEKSISQIIADERNEGYNKARQEDYDKLDEVIDYIYADLEEKVESLCDGDAYFPVGSEFCAGYESALKDILDLLTNKE